MRLISKSAVLVIFAALSNFGLALANNENHDIAVIMVAMGRMCAEQRPEMNYSLQNVFVLPEVASNAELKKEIIEVDADPAFQAGIKVVQMQATADPSAIGQFCPSYAPSASAHVGPDGR